MQKVVGSNPISRSASIQNPREAGCLLAGVFLSGSSGIRR
jgi:hypothetical protein